MESSGQGADTTWRVESLPHPVVPLVVATTDDDVVVRVSFARTVDFLGPEAEAAGAVVRAWRGTPTPAARQLSEYVEGSRREFDLRWALIMGTEFEQACWRALANVRWGETISYLDQAHAVESPGAVRAVGRANGKNPLPLILPCHRVVGADGSLTGFGGGLEAKRWLLDHESSQLSLGIG